ncbi:MAG: ABC transporter permease [Acidovorax sp. 16-64-162]|uniref:ABC transporter permease n=1 Tax=Acidovorax sp. 16-64-162 TaxID=1970307 RepID=UPI000BD1B12B|nr:ABC transporter permease [Acidovorax sp. 16-64-162]OYZ44388.1 MAG: ABC transporter permease [Acidovorax sp. 16-64-162]
MLRLLWRVFAGLPAYVWSGWGAAASLLLLLTAWEAVAALYDPLILPDPLTAFAALWAQVKQGAAWPALWATARRALMGLALALGVGSVLGLLAGLSVTASVLARPLVTVLLGTPPIAWLVLAMLWFGMSDGTPVFTVFIACFPVVFASALQGTRTLDLQLRDMARAYRLPLGMALREVYGPAWKVAVMAELLASTDGVGAALAASRSQLDTATTLGWISAVVGCLLVVEYGFLEPLKREVERWREAPR